MSFISWLTTKQPHTQQHTLPGNCHLADSTESPEEPADLAFSDIATRFLDLSNEVASLQNQLANEKARHLEHQQNHALELAKLRHEFSEEHATVASLQLAIAHFPQKAEGLRAQGAAGPFVALLNSQRKQQQTTANELRNTRKTVNALSNTNGALRQQVAELQAKVTELEESNSGLKFDLEYVKCTAGAVCELKEQQVDVEAVNPIIPLIEVPFVLALIDGDAYSFVSEGSEHSRLESALHPATKVTRSIKSYLQAYIVEHKLPINSKLIVRVLQNIGPKLMKKFNTLTRNGRAISFVEDFMIQFSESAPLFDYVDAGSGKERVDGKIHEHYHTFISNSACHKIFLAAATDNGFARLLEQYVDHPTARAKTCLISCGVIAPEIERLDLETVEWPLVFSMRILPKPSSRALKRRLEREQKQQLEDQKHQRAQEETIKRLGYEAYQRRLVGLGIARITKDFTESEDPAVITRALRGFGHISPRSVSRSTMHSDSEVNGDWDISTEEGVD